MDIKQVTETIAMIEEQNFDVRTITMGISLLDCIDSDIDKAAEKVYNKIVSKAKNLFQLLTNVSQLRQSQSLVQRQMRQTMYHLPEHLIVRLKKSVLTLLVVFLPLFKRATKKVMRFLLILSHVRLLRLILSAHL